MEDREKSRLEAVHRYRILDTPPDGAFDRVALLAGRVFQAPMATVTIVDEDRIWFKASQGLPNGVTQIAREPGLCASAILQDEPYIVPDALRDPRSMENSLVRGRLGVRFYAAAPIITHEGYRFGTVNVLDTRPRETNQREISLLEALASVVAEQLEIHLAALRSVHDAEATLQTVLETRPVIERAVGMIMLAHSCDEPAAWEVLREQSMNYNVKVRAIAQAMDRIVAGADLSELAPSCRRAAQLALSAAPKRQQSLHADSPALAAEAES